MELTAAMSQMADRFGTYAEMEERSAAAEAVANLIAGHITALGARCDALEQRLAVLEKKSGPPT